MDIDLLAIISTGVYFLRAWALPLLVSMLLILVITKNSNWKPTRKRKWFWVALLASIIFATYPWFFMTIFSNMSTYIIATIFVFARLWALLLLTVFLIILALTRVTRWAPSQMRKWLWAALVASILATYPWFSVVEEINGRVVDETGQPIEGVLVTAIWLAHLRMINSDLLASSDLRATELVNAMESVTDADGRYQFPGFFYVSPLLWRIKKDEPDMGFYKKGLGTDYSLTDFPRDKGLFKTDLLQKSKFNNITVVMVEMDAKTQQTSDESQALKEFVTYTLFDFDCMWANIPDAITYLYEDTNAFQANAPKTKIHIFEDQVKLYGSGSQYSRSMSECGVDIGFFKGLSEWNIKILPK